MPNPNTFESPLVPSKPDVFMSPLPAPVKSQSAPVVHHDDHSEPVAVVVEPEPVPMLLPVTGGGVSGSVLLFVLGVACLMAGVRHKR